MTPTGHRGLCATGKFPGMFQFSICFYARAGTGRFPSRLAGFENAGGWI